VRVRVRARVRVRVRIRVRDDGSVTAYAHAARRAAHCAAVAPAGQSSQVLVALGLVSVRG